MRRLNRAALALGCCWLAGAHAQERGEEREEPRERSREQEQPPAPDLDFLEYLGAWAEDDDEWLAIETWEKELGQEAEKDPNGVENERDDDDESE
jgi:hypothetical protein